ncbi:MAG: MBL fold metallo-hydrolase [Bacteroidota bacterium]|nr:MBL fold metallo-hydrolase [Bacteroidota bacterium]
MQLIPIHAGHLSCDGGALFGVVPKPLWSKTYPADKNNITKLTMRCLLIDLGERKILVDAGVGNHYSEKFRQNNGHEETDVMEQSLAGKGYRVEDITDVLFTHLHCDHSNGAVLNENGQLKLQFPNATHWCSKRQWEHSKISNIRERAAYFPEILNFLKSEGNMKLIGDDCELFPGISVRLFDGHTTGLLVPVIHTEEKTVVYPADLIPTAAHIPIVWLPAYDLYPVTSMEEKERFLKEAAEKEYILFFEHDIYTECATVEWTEKGPMMKEIFRL